MLEYPLRDFPYVSGLLGKSDEIDGHHQAARWMFPTHQRLDVMLGIALKRDLGLVHQRELVGSNRLA